MVDVTGFVAVKADGMAWMEEEMPDCKVSIGAFMVSITDSPVKRDTTTPRRITTANPIAMNGAYAEKEFCHVLNLYSDENTL
jgi:hypothetical protein